MNRWMKSFFAILAPLLLIGLAAAFSGSDDPPAGWDGFGEGVTLSERTAIEDILARPEKFEGRSVAVEGEVVGVCKMMGCWVELRNETDDRIRVKVEDGVIVFPESALGKRSVAQGVVEVLEFTREEALERARHEAEEMETDFDPDSVAPPYREVRLRGTGAWIDSGATP